MHKAAPGHVCWVDSEHCYYWSLKQLLTSVAELSFEFAFSPMCVIFSIESYDLVRPLVEETWNLGSHERKLRTPGIKSQDWQTM